MWQWLRNRKCFGAKFRREVPIGPYTADFCCIELMLIIEIDGDPHCTEQGREHDRVRDSYLTKLGYKILRVPGYEVIVKMVSLPSKSIYLLRLRSTRNGHSLDIRPIEYSMPMRAPHPPTLRFELQTLQLKQHKILCDQPSRKTPMGCIQMLQTTQNEVSPSPLYSGRRGDPAT